jgi:hypothetical protein
VSDKEELKQVARWERALWELLREIEIANGECDTDLEASVRLTWKQARRDLDRAEHPNAVPSV